MGKKRNLRRLSMLVTAQTASSLMYLAEIAGYREMGRVVDKLVREKMVGLHIRRGSGEDGHLRDPAKMVRQTLTDLRRLSVQTGSLACLGCGREHSCGVHGCRILRDAMELITVLEKR